MQKWQSENKEQRAFFCVGVSEHSTIDAMQGCGLMIIHALITSILHDKDTKDLIKGAMEATEDPIKGLLLEHKWLEYAKEHGIIKEEEEKSDKSSIKSSLKDLLQTLADKL